MTPVLALKDGELLEGVPLQVEVVLVVQEQGGGTSAAELECEVE